MMVKAMVNETARVLLERQWNQQVALCLSMKNLEAHYLLWMETPKQDRQ